MPNITTSIYILVFSWAFECVIIHNVIFVRNGVRNILLVFCSHCYTGVYWLGIYCFSCIVQCWNKLTYLQLACACALAVVVCLLICSLWCVE